VEEKQMTNFETLVDEVIEATQIPKNRVENILIDNGFEERTIEAVENDSFNELIEEALLLFDTISAFRSTDMRAVLDPDEDEN
jgi:hypothetical protein